VTYATLMVHLELGHPNAGLLKVAGGLAERFHAGVIGIVACQPMQIFYGDGYIPGEVVEQDRDELATEIRAAEQEFRAALASRVGRLEWRSTVTFDPLPEYLAREARSADLMVTGVDRTTSLFDKSRHVDVSDLVMQIGRPVLVVPATADKAPLNRVVVGWKDTGETRRAVSDAMPLLQAAGRVTVVEVAAGDDQPAARKRLADVVAWLKCHDVVAEPLVLASNGDDVGVLNAIAQELAADLIVAGAYGHSRLREWVLGGVTRDLLLRATRCSLVSH
jgi:nucleotide-binding universal stress UspA family protein